MTGSNALGTTPANRPRPTDGDAPRWAAFQELRRRAVLDAALRSIARSGPQVTVEQVAAEAGVTRVHVYRQFATADAFHCAVADRIRELVTADLAAWHQDDTTLDLIRATVEGHIGWFLRHPNLYRYLRARSQGTPDRERAAIQEVEAVMRRELTRVMAQCLEQVGIDPRTAGPMTFAAVGLVDSCAARWLDNPQGLEPGELAGLLTRWVWRILDSTGRSHERPRSESPARRLET